MRSNETTALPPLSCDFAGARTRPIRPRTRRPARSRESPAAKVGVVALRAAPEQVDLGRERRVYRADRRPRDDDSSVSSDVAHGKPAAAQVGQCLGDSRRRRTEVGSILLRGQPATEIRRRPIALRAHQGQHLLFVSSLQQENDVEGRAGIDRSEVSARPRRPGAGPCAAFFHEQPQPGCPSPEQTQHGERLEQPELLARRCRRWDEAPETASRLS